MGLVYPRCQKGSYRESRWNSTRPRAYSEERGFLVTEGGTLRHMGSAMAKRACLRGLHRLTLSCYPKTEVNTARLRRCNATGKKGWAATPASTWLYLSRFLLNEVSGTAGHGVAMLERHRWEEAGPVPPTSSSYQSHLVRTRILADIPLGVCFNVRCCLSSQMMDLCGHTTRSKGTACPEGMLPCRQGSSLSGFACA